MSRIVDIEKLLQEYADYEMFTGHYEYDDGFNSGVWHIIDELENLPVIECETQEYATKSKVLELKDNECQCIFCKKVITDDEIFRMKDNPQKGICFRCY